MVRHASWNECTLSKYVYVEWLGEVVGKKETHHQRTPQSPPATILVFFKHNNIEIERESREV